MHQTSHVEKHFTASATVRDIVIGMADGLTVPFALAAGLTGAVNSSGLIMTAGLAEVAAGAIAMGLGGYLAARTDAEHYANERAVEEREIDEIPHREQEEVATVFRGFGLEEAQVEQVVRAVCSDRTRWIDFMMKFELGLDEPDAGRARTSALTIAGAYVVGGLIPLAPYLLFSTVRAGLLASVVVTGVALAAFGYIKGRFTGTKPLGSAWQTLAVGGLAAAVAFALARAIGGT
ncbi:MAG TPA: VIT1/CCC1 transporter family protein [Pirellulales bacterium]|nr:VIT1/CCC1 transporter family protein [Pirellulales bacterium]